MRYRCFGRSDTAISALTLELRDTPGKARAADWRNIVFCALENGINAFEVQSTASPGLLAGVAEAFAAIERRLVFVTYRIRIMAGDFQDGTILRSASEAAEKLGLTQFDCVMLEGEHLEVLTPMEIDCIEDLRDIAHHIGVCGDERLDNLVRRGKVDAIATTYSLASPVRDRSRIRLLGEAGAAVIAYDACPGAITDPKREPLRRSLFRKPVFLTTGGYDFLHETWGWTAEQICLAYVLTEPGVTTIRIAAIDPKRIASLAEVVDRDVPGGLGAQVEMARFAQPEAPPIAAKRRRA